jgi:hypothetical protein
MKRLGLDSMRSLSTIPTRLFMMPIKLSRCRQASYASRASKCSRASLVCLAPKLALARLRRIQRHCISINQAAPISCISPINTEQTRALAALNIKRPTQDPQMF